MITHPNVKVNAGLHVLRRRTDGFHDIETLFVPYHGLHDTLEIVAGDDYSRTSAGLFQRYSPSQIAQDISPDGKLMVTLARREGLSWEPLADLTARAYFLLQEEHRLPPVKIFLEKTSPVGAGLGGGSADAAFALRMLNELGGLHLSGDALASCAARLGSDCAFFLCNRPMIGEGRGEILSPFAVPALEACTLKVIVPEGIEISTAEAYSGIVPHPPKIPLRTALSLPLHSWREHLVNDFEAPVFARHPALASLKESLYADGALYVSLSGSGSALFALYRQGPS